MDKSTLILIINGLIGLVLTLFGFILNQALGEIKQLRQRMHDALNHISAIKATILLMEKDLTTRVSRIETYLNGLLKSKQ